MPIISKENAEENLSEIEKIRLRNIAERKKIFEDLNLDSLKKKAKAHSDYLKAQIAAKRLQCHKCDPIKQFPNISLKKNHDISVHIGRRSSYPRAPVKEIVKKPSTPKPSKRPPMITFSQEYWNEFPFISYSRSQTSSDFRKKKTAYCNTCCTKVKKGAADVRIHMNSKMHQKNVESVMDQKCEICKMVVSEDLTAHLMTHMKTCSVLIFKFE